MDHRELHSETVVVTKRRRLVHQLRLLGLLIPLLLLLACMPFGAVIGQASQPSGPTPPGMGVPIAFDDLPPTARCRIAAEFALTTNGLIYSQGGNLKDENGNIIDPIDPRTGTYYPRTGPDSYDCSGMTMVAYGQAGVQIESNTREQV
jgi:cell wall-associated NlpC family hydrolase